MANAPQSPGTSAAPVPSMATVARCVLQVSFLRRILIACGLLAVFLPLFSWTYLAPAHHLGNALLLLTALTLLGVVAAALYRAGRAILAHQEVDLALQRAHDDLEQRVAMRTRDLRLANEALELEIAQHRAVEAALRDSEALFRQLLETIPNPVFYKDDQGVFMGCNAAYRHTVGLSKEQIMGRRLVDLPGITFSDMAEHYHRQDLALIRTPGIQVHEEQLICADGRLRDYMLFKATFRDETGKVAGLVGVMLDITERKQMVKALEESQALFDAFMHHLPGLAVIKDLEGRYIYVNHAFSRFVGMANGAPVGMDDGQVWGAATASQLRAADQAVRQSRQAVNGVETVTPPGRRPRHLLVTRFPIFQESALTALGAVAIDITEHTETEQRQRQLERQLQQAQKMEALGTLAGGIAHDFNNILASVIGYTQIAQTDLPAESPVQPYLKRVLEAGERAVALVKQILTFSRKGDTEPQPVQMGPILKEVLQLVRATLPATIAVDKRIHSDAAVMADPVQIHQVMMNLCANAGHAMRDSGGTLTVTLEDVVLDAAFARRHADVIRPGPHVRLSVADTGHGISPEHTGRIFEPFFTTKPKGEGTGMGLSVVHGIVTRLGGTVTVDSAPGKGARFDIHLPVLPHAPVSMKQAAGALPAGNERILLVDDEPFQTDMLKHMLGLLGYKVTACNSGNDALALFEKDPGAFDLVITDLMMPELRGDALARRMLARRNDLPIILCTGFGENISSEQTEAMGIRAFTLKPLNMETLARLVRDVLDAASSDTVAAQ